MLKQLIKMGSYISLFTKTICCLHPSCLPGNTYCKKCGVSTEYYTDCKNITNSCREHRFKNSECTDCLASELYTPHNCVHIWE